MHILSALMPFCKPNDNHNVTSWSFETDDQTLNVLIFSNRTVLKLVSVVMATLSSVPDLV